MGLFDRKDAELERYRNLMRPPEVFEDGFNIRAAAGAAFVGFFMLPASMYLNLYVGGGGVSAAAQWVTVILFAEIARRSLKELKVQEVYILFFMSGLALSSPFSGLLWNQYLVQAEPMRAMGIAQEIPSWVAPSAAIVQRDGRTFFTQAWLVPILLISLSLVVGQLDNYGLGYVLYRLTNDVEELPFPMAPVGAAGITALTDVKGSKEPWRWRCFSIGGMIGIAFAALYITLPAVSSQILNKRIELLPIPWVDFTQRVGDTLPATPLTVAFNLGSFFWGLVMPFWAAIGSAIGVLSTFIINPLLYHAGILTSWSPQMKVVDTLYSNNVDFYLSFGVGQTMAIVIISMAQIIGPVLLYKKWKSSDSVQDRSREAASAGNWKRLLTDDPRRGDFSIYIALGIYIFTSIFWIVLSSFLIEGFPWQFFAFYAAVYTPLISYASAKLEGIAGQAVQIPYIREATYILSGYQGVKIWFAPAPLTDYGQSTVRFRVMELTGTKLKGTIKATLAIIPVMVVSSLIFSHLIWQIADVPSNAFPFAQQQWDLEAKKAALTYSSTMGGSSLFMEAWKWKYFGWGMGTGLASFGILSYFGMPTLLVYGVVRGLGQNNPAFAFLELAGALVGRFYFRRKYGDMWLSYAPVLVSGFACGTGLMAMVSVAVVILVRMMSPLSY